MKDITKSELGSCIKKYVFGNTKFGKNRYDLKTLFKLYSLHEVEDLSKITKNWNEFVDFLSENTDEIISSAKIRPTYKVSYQKQLCQLENEISSQLHDLKFNIDVFSMPTQRACRKIYSGIVGDIIQSNGVKVLEVGSGPIPDTSFEIAKKAEKVYAMDNFIVALDFIRNRGVEPIEEMFTTKTNTGNYDLIVGKDACKAIRPIVEVCSKTNTPYFLELCACDLENQWVGNKKGANSWKEVLPNIDPNIKMYKRFAHNLDISDSQLEKIIETNIQKNNQFEFGDGATLDGEFSDLLGIAVDAMADCLFEGFLRFLGDFGNFKN